MRILAFDTATTATAVALTDTDRGLALERRDDPPRGARPRHTAALMPLVAEVLRSARLGWSDLDRIAVGVGPGTFTGLRVGVATARALARARGLALVGVSTLRSLALNASELDPPPATVIAVLDARRSEVFAAAWPAVSILDRDALIAPAALPPEQLAAIAAGLPEPVLAVGDGAVEYREVLERSGVAIPVEGSEIHRVTAINHCQLAATLPVGAPEQVRPAYLRLPDAEIARRAAGTQ